MNELVLRSYETFSEIPDGNLLVKENSNLMYVRIGRYAFIAREFIDSIQSDEQKSIYSLSYYNVKDNTILLTMQVKRNLSNDEVVNLNETKDIDITPLSEILNIKGNNVTFVSLSDIDSLVNFKGDYISGEKISII